MNPETPIINIYFLFIRLLIYLSLSLHRVLKNILNQKLSLHLSLTCLGTCREYSSLTHERGQAKVTVKINKNTYAEYTQERIVSKAVQKSNVCNSHTKQNK